MLYYSDSTRTIQVGERINHCKTAAEQYGTVTAYSRTIERYSCDGPIP